MKKVKFLDQITTAGHGNSVLMAFVLIVPIVVLLLFINFSDWGKGKEANIITGDVEIVLFERDPWAMLIGGESPVFVKYKDGLTIYKNGDKYYSYKMTKEEDKAFLDNLKLDESIFSCKSLYSLTNATDQKTTELYLYAGDKFKIVEIYGSLEGYLKSENKGFIPADLINIYDTVKKYSNKNAAEWIPDKIEVVAWSYSYAPEKSVEWPGGWPDLHSKDTINRSKNKDDESYSIFIKKENLPDLKMLISNLKEKQAILINGRKMTVVFRCPFNREGVWKDDYRKSRESGKNDSVRMEMHEKELQEGVDENKKNKILALQKCKELMGYDLLIKDFKIKDAMQGYINGLPESLHVGLEGNDRELVNAAWWFNPIENGQPKYNWNDFIGIYNKFNKVAENKPWLKKWRKEKTGRTIDAEIFGVRPNTEMDIEYFVIPAWEHAGLKGELLYEVILRDGNSFQTVYMSEESEESLDANGFHLNSEKCSYCIISKDGKRKTVEIKQKPQDPRTFYLSKMKTSAKINNLKKVVLFLEKVYSWSEVDNMQFDISKVEELKPFLKEKSLLELQEKYKDRKK